MAADRRVLVATAGRRCPLAGLREARALAGPRGEVVLAVVLVVPVTQPLDATREGAVEHACEVLDQADRAASGPFDTRLVRARSFAKGVLQTLEGEAFDLLLVERDAAQMREPAPAGQVAALLEKAPVPMVILRPLAPRPSAVDGVPQAGGSKR